MRNMKKIKTFLPIALLILFPLLTLAQWDSNELIDVSELPEGSIYDTMENLMEWILGIFGFIGIIGFVISGIMYLTAAGDEDQITKAKSAMKWSIVGVIVGLGGFVAIQAIDSWLDEGTKF